MTKFRSPSCATSVAFVLIGNLLLLSAWARAQTAATAHDSPAPDTRTSAVKALRVGVYDSRAVCVASRNFPAIVQQRNKQMAELQKELKDAQAAGDEKRAVAIKQRGSALQAAMHLKAFSNAPVDDILALIPDQLAQIARDAGVEVIVAKLDFQSQGIEVIDVTDRLVAAFDPDDKTLKTVEELRKRKPIDMAEVLAHKD